MRKRVSWVVMKVISRRMMTCKVICIGRSRWWRGCGASGGLGCAWCFGL
jgi:hypothetical protein